MFANCAIGIFSSILCEAYETTAQQRAGVARWRSEPCTPRNGPRFSSAQNALQNIFEMMSGFFLSLKPTPAKNRISLNPPMTGAYSTSTLLQLKFRAYPAIGDGTCLVTDADFDDCTASHILPQNRPKVKIFCSDFFTYMPDIETLFQKLPFSSA